MMLRGHFGFFVRNAMGLCSSPYVSIQGGLCAKRIITGKRTRENNAYQWDRLVQNFLFAENYLAKLIKLQELRSDGKLASKIVQYVDDNHDIACCPEQSWLASSQMAKGLCWLSLQNATQERQRYTQCPRACT